MNMADFPLISNVIPPVGIKVSFIDNDGKKIGGLTVDQANKIAENYPDKKFYFQSGDGVEKELTIEQVNNLLPTDLLPTAPSCPTDPQVCGPPLVKFFGGNGGFGAAANAIISPISSSVIGFDIVNSGFGFLGTPSAEIIDPCGKGSGTKLKVNMQNDVQNTTNIQQLINDQLPNNQQQLIPTPAAPAAPTPAPAAPAAPTPAPPPLLDQNILDFNGNPLAVDNNLLSSDPTVGPPVIVNDQQLTLGSIGGTQVELGGSGGTPLISGSNPITIGGVTLTTGSSGGTPIIINGLPLSLGGSGGSVISVSPITAQDYNQNFTDCDSPRNQFANSILNSISRSKTIKNITILAPGDGYLASPDGSLGGDGRVWKEPDEGYVKTKCGGYYVVQPYRPVSLQKGDTYYPPVGPPKVIEEDEDITLPLLPVNPQTPVIQSISGVQGTFISQTPTTQGGQGVQNIGANKNPTYPVILLLEEIEVVTGGFGYRPGDNLIIDPKNGAEAKLNVNERGEIESIDVINSGAGFVDLPDIRTDSLTGFNATFSPILKAIRIDLNRPIEEQLGKKIPPNVEIINVVDCVGRVF